MANKSIKGTRTEQNLANSYIAESTAVTRYTFFSDKAKKDSYFQYANIFAETAANELRHAKIFLQYQTEGKVESHHEARFNKMIERIETDTVWKREKPIKWQCLVCGYVMEGTEPPKKCPVCNHPYQHFQPMEDNY